MLPWLKLGSPMLSQSSFYSSMCLSAIFLRIEPSLSLRLLFCACACGQFLFVMKSRLQLGSEVYADLALANDIGHLHHLGLVLEPFMGEDSLGIVRFLVKIPTV